MWLFDKIEDMVDDAKTKAGAKEPMTGYGYHYGGNMCGNSHSESVSKADEGHALISTEHRNWHYEDPKVEEYLADISIIKELESVFRKYSMQKWHGKKFTDVFVCDGETYGYSFEFGKAEISFSSQMFPNKYYKKLKELHDIMDRYVEKAEKLPGLVIQPMEDDERPRFSRDDDEVHFDVFEYRENRLYYRLVNGTDNEFEWNQFCRVFREGEKEPFFEKENPYPSKAYGHGTEESYVKLPERLGVGKYRLESGVYSYEFEIALQ